MHIFSSDEADYDSYADYNEDVRNGKKLDKQEPWYWYKYHGKNWLSIELM